MQILPILVSFITKKDLLACRQVCQRWSADVDNYLLETGSGIEDNWYRPLVKSIKFPLSKRQQKSLAAMANHARNPFVGSRLSLQPQQRYSMENRNQMNTFLTVVGKHVYHLECVLPFRRISEDTANILPLEIANKCVNLKALSISGLMEFPDPPTKPNLVRPLLPDLAKLERIVSFTGSTSQLYLQDMLEKYHMQLKSLDIDNLDQDGHLRLEWPCLECLSLTLVKSERGLNNLLKLKAPKLEQLSLEMTNGCMINITDLIRITNKFPVLKRLILFPAAVKSLILSKAQTKEISDMQERLCSASVEIVEVKLRTTELNYLASFDFLLFFPNLKTLKIKVYGNRADRRPSGEHGLVIRLIDNLINDSPYSPTVYESNVWEVCKRLTKIVVNRMVYTRDLSELLVLLKDMKNITPRDIMRLYNYQISGIMVHS